MKSRLALLCLVAASLNEFGWQLDEQNASDIRTITVSVLVWCLCTSLAIVSKDKYITAVCVSCSVMQLTTMGCSVMYLIDPESLLFRDSRCSDKMNYLLMLTSAAIGGITVSIWGDDGD